MQTYIFRINESDKEWDEIEGHCMKFPSHESAVEFSYKLSELFKREVRMNFAGSFQGYYFMYVKKS